MIERSGIPKSTTIWKKKKKKGKKKKQANPNPNPVQDSFHEGDTILKSSFHEAIEP